MNATPVEVGSPVDWSTLVAVLALVLSVVSLGWQIIRSWWERPVLLVRGTLRSWSPTDQELGWKAELVITNVGERPVTITDAGWWYSTGTHEEDIERADGGHVFPSRLEPHDQLRLSGFLPEESSWLYPNGGIFVKDWDGADTRAARPYVEVVRRPLRWRLTTSEGATRVWAAPIAIPNPREGI
ncbi:hypothetical protein [Microbacterium laevaniformans]|uniref:hypothetical protein n=1 Tax=Microbacterium laevaniformans TaxID=36807 RepID=UPI003D99F6EC